MAVDDDDADVPDSGVVFTFGKCKFNDNVPGKFWIKDESVIAVSCGDEHTAVLSENGKLFMFGDNAWGQCGVGTAKLVRKPTRVKELKEEKVIQVSCGKSHTLALTESGKLYSFGAGGDGQLGLDSTPDGADKVSVPTVIRLPRSTRIKMLAAGAYHSAYLTESGEMYVWGSGSEGQLGLGDIEKAPTPTHVDIDERVTHISCGYYHTAVVTASGRLLVCGEAEFGKLGLGEDVTENQTTLQHVSSIDRVASAACGHNHTAAVTDTGKVYTFGQCSNGQLGRGNLADDTYKPTIIKWSKPTKIVQASCGEAHTALVTDGGLLYTCGDGRHGKLALGENFSNQCVPILVTRFSMFAVQQVSCGGCHMLVVARRRPESNDSLEDSINEADEDVKQTPISEMIRRGEVSNSVDLSVSITARNRRREKLPDPNTMSLSRNLPALTSPSLDDSSGGGDNPLNKGQLPAINKQKAGSTFTALPSSQFINDPELINNTPQLRASLPVESAIPSESVTPAPVPALIKDETDYIPAVVLDELGNVCATVFIKPTRNIHDVKELPELRITPLPKPRRQTPEIETLPTPVPRGKLDPAAPPPYDERKESGFDDSEEEDSKNRTQTIQTTAMMHRELEEAEEERQIKSDQFISNGKGGTKDKKKEEEEEYEDEIKPKPKGRTGLFGRKKVEVQIEHDEEEEEEDDDRGKKKHGRKFRKDKREDKKKNGKKPLKDDEQDDEEEDEEEEERRKEKKRFRLRKNKKSATAAAEGEGSYDDEEEKLKKNGTTRSRAHEEDDEEEEEGEGHRDRDTSVVQEDKTQPSGTVVEEPKPEEKKKSRTCIIL